jgi:alkyldihydroxyacetonephosphate synthase
MTVNVQNHLRPLEEIVGVENVLTDEAALKEGEGRNKLFAKHFGIYPNPLPIAVVKARSTEEISNVLRYCDQNGIIVIPRTGASSGEGLLEVREAGNTIILDASPMNALIKIDKYNMVATAQCGFPLEQLENLASEQGLTTGHFPQSLPLAHMGGLVATRSIGQFSTYYGGIEDLIVGFEAVLPNGEIIRIRNVPRRAAGPDLRHILVGSEGALGVITEVTVKLFPASPHDGWMGGYIVKNMMVGFEAIREIMTRGYKPAVVRLYDKPDIDYNFGSVKLQDEEAYMFFTAEGPAEIVQLTGEAIHKIALEFGARDSGTKAVEHWLVHRNDLCWKMNDPVEIEKAKQHMTLYATTEIAADWSDIKKIYNDVMENVPPQIDGLVMLGGHVSHSYINGTNIYFVYRYKISKPENESREHLKIVNAISEIVLKYPTGGCVHHHGMGKHRIGFAEKEHGTSYVLMKGLKKLLDPNNIMSRGNLVQVYEER